MVYIYFNSGLRRREVFNFNKINFIKFSYDLFFACVSYLRNLYFPKVKEFLLYFLLKILWLNFDIWVMLFPGFPGSSACKESACNVGDLGSIPGEGNGNPIRYSCLEDSVEQRNLAGYSLWDCKESKMTERLSLHSDVSTMMMKNFLHMV